MLRISALNDSSSSDDELAPTQVTKTKEAKEAEAFALYNKVLSYQQSGSCEYAEKSLRNLFEHPFLKEAANLLDEDDYEWPVTSPVHPGLQLLYLVHKNLAAILLQRKDFKHAMDSYIHAVQIDRTEVTVWFKMGQIATKLHNYPLSKICYQQALQCNPNHWPSIDGAITITFALGDYLSCLEHISCALEKDCYFTKGLVFRREILKDQPSLESITKELFVYCDPVIHTTTVDKEEAKMHLDECARIQSKRKELLEEYNEKEFKPMTFLNPLAPFTWKNVGERLLELYEYATTSDPPKSMGLEIDMRDYNFLDQSIIFGTSKPEILSHNKCNNKTGSTLNKDVTNPSQQIAELTKTSSVKRPASALLLKSVSCSGDADNIPRLGSPFQRAQEESGAMSTPDVLKIRDFAKEDALMRRLKGDGRRQSKDGDGLTSSSTTPSRRQSTEMAGSSTDLSSKPTPSDDPFADLEDVDVEQDFGKLEEAMNISDINLADIQRTDFVPDLFLKASDDDLVTVNEARSLENVLSTVIDMEFGVEANVKSSCTDPKLASSSATEQKHDEEDPLPPAPGVKKIKLDDEFKVESKTDSAGASQSSQKYSSSTPTIMATTQHAASLPSGMPLPLIEKIDLNLNATTTALTSMSDHVKVSSSNNMSKLEPTTVSQPHTPVQKDILPMTSLSEQSTSMYQSCLSSTPKSHLDQSSGSIYSTPLSGPVPKVRDTSKAIEISDQKAMDAKKTVSVSFEECLDRKSKVTPTIFASPEHAIQTNLTVPHTKSPVTQQTQHIPSPKDPQLKLLDKINTEELIEDIVRKQIIGPTPISPSQSKYCHTILPKAHTNQQHSPMRSHVDLSQGHRKEPQTLQAQDQHYSNKRSHADLSQGRRQEQQTFQAHDQHHSHKRSLIDISQGRRQEPQTLHDQGFISPPIAHSVPKSPLPPSPPSPSLTFPPTAHTSPFLPPYDVHPALHKSPPRATQDTGFSYSHQQHYPFMLHPSIGPPHSSLPRVDFPVTPRQRSLSSSGSITLPPYQLNALSALEAEALLLETSLSTPIVPRLSQPPGGTLVAPLSSMHAPKLLHQPGEAVAEMYRQHYTRLRDMNHNPQPSWPPLLSRSSSLPGHLTTDMQNLSWLPHSRPSTPTPSLPPLTSGSKLHLSSPSGIIGSSQSGATAGLSYGLPIVSSPVSRRPPQKSVVSLLQSPPSSGLNNPFTNPNWGSQAYSSGGDMMYSRSPKKSSHKSPPHSQDVGFKSHQPDKGDLFHAMVKSMLQSGNNSPNVSTKQQQSSKSSKSSSTPHSSPKGISATTSTKRGPKRKSDTSWLDEEWAQAYKRRSTRARNPKTKKDTRAPDFGNLMRQYFPSSLVVLECEDEGNAAEKTRNDKDTTKEKAVDGTTDEDIAACSKLEDSEDTDVKAFVKSCLKRHGLLEMIRKYLLRLSEKTDMVWYSGLEEIYVKLYGCLRKHITIPSIWFGNDGDMSPSRLRDYASIMLAEAELSLTKVVAERGLTGNVSTPSKVSSSLPQPTDLFGEFHTTDSRYLECLTQRDDLFDDARLAYPEFCARVFWLQAWQYRVLGLTLDAVDCYEMVKETLNENVDKSSEKGPVYMLPNCSHARVISLQNVCAMLESVQRCRKLEDTRTMFQRQEYSAVVENLMSTFTDSSDKSSSCKERPSQLLLLLDSLVSLGDGQEVMKWGEICLHEAILHYQRAPSIQLRQDWADTLVSLFETVDGVMDEDENVVSALSHRRLVRLAHNLVTVIKTILDVAESVTDMPIASVRPWKILYRVLKYEEDSNAKTKHKMSPKSVEVNTNDMNIEENDEEKEDDEGELRPSLTMLMKAHEYLGGHSWCTRENGLLLHFMMNVLGKELYVKGGDDDSDDESDEDKSTAFEQCVYCLYSHPNKRGRARHLSDHNATAVDLTWELAGPVFRYFAPRTVPEYDSYKTSTVSADVEHLLRKIYSLVPDSLHPGKQLVAIQEYVEGNADKVAGDVASPQFTSPVRVIKDTHQLSPGAKSLLDPFGICKLVYYLLGDYHFKREDPAKAIKFYQLDLALNSTRLDSWAGLALARMSQLTQKLNATELKMEVPLVKKADAALRCFIRAVNIDNTSHKLWLEYGSLAYQLQSHASRQLCYRHMLKIPGEVIVSSRQRKTEMLSLAKQNYSKAQECEGHGSEDDWLTHYMLGKVAEKLAEHPSVFLDCYKQAALCLHEEEAVYPAKLQFTTLPPHLALEALEIFYRTMTSSLKLLLSGCGVQYLEVLNSFVSEALEGHFAQREEKPQQRTKDVEEPSSPPVHSSLEPQPDLQCLKKARNIYHKNPVGHEYSRHKSMSDSQSEGEEKKEQGECRSTNVTADGMRSHVEESVLAIATTVDSGTTICTTQVKQNSTQDSYQNVFEVFTAGLTSGNQTSTEKMVDPGKGDQNNENVRTQNEDADSLVTALEKCDVEDVSENKQEYRSGEQNATSDSSKINSGSNTRVTCTETDMEVGEVEGNTVELTPNVFVASASHEPQAGSVTPNVSSLVITGRDMVEKHTKDASFSEKTTPEIENHGASFQKIPNSISLEESRADTLVDKTSENTSKSGEEKWELEDKEKGNLGKGDTASVIISPVTQSGQANDLTRIKEKVCDSTPTASSVPNTNISTTDCRNATSTKPNTNSTSDCGAATSTNSNTNISTTDCRTSASEKPNTNTLDKDSSTTSNQTQDPKKLWSEVTQKCVRGLELCVTRYSSHYKSLYRLAQAHYILKDYNKARDLLLGCPDWQNLPHMPAPGLFSDRRQNNFFQGLWKMPVDDIERSGSFASHLHRSVRLLIDVLVCQRDLDTLLLIRNQLKRTPDAGKKYLRDAERLVLAEEAYLGCVRLIDMTMEKQGHTWSEARREENLLAVYRIWTLGKGGQYVETTTNALLTAFRLMMKGRTDVTRLRADQAILYCNQNLAKLLTPTTPSQGSAGAKVGMEKGEKGKSLSNAPVLNLQKYEKERSEQQIFPSYASESNAAKMPALKHDKPNASPQSLVVQNSPKSISTAKQTKETAISSHMLSPLAKPTGHTPQSTSHNLITKPQATIKPTSLPNVTSASSSPRAPLPNVTLASSSPHAHLQNVTSASSSPRTSLPNVTSASSSSRTSLPNVTSASSSQATKLQRPPTDKLLTVHDQIKSNLATSEVPATIKCPTKSVKNMSETPKVTHRDMDDEDDDVIIISDPE